MRFTAVALAFSSLLLSTPGSVEASISAQSHAHIEGLGLAGDDLNNASSSDPGFAAQTANSSAYGVELNHINERNASSDSSVSVLPGEFHALLEAQATQRLPSSSFVGAVANVSGSWQDTILLSSSTLAPGAAVTLTASVALNYKLWIIDSRDPANGQSVLWVSTIRTFVNGNAYEYTERDSGRTGTTTFTIDGKIGKAIDLSQTFFAAVNTNPVNYENVVNLKLDLSHTARFYLTPDSDFTFTSQSGASYAPQASVATPEPASFAVWCGLVLVGGLVRRRGWHG